nr:hypothetical protein [Oscillospiraceae bacterium]
VGERRSRTVGKESTGYPNRCTIRMCNDKHRTMHASPAGAGPLNRNLFFVYKFVENCFHLGHWEFKSSFYTDRRNTAMLVS